LGFFGRCILRSGGDGAGAARRVKVFIDKPEQLPASGTNFLQIRGDVAGALLPAFLDEHLGVADDLVERRPEFVKKTAGNRLPTRYTARVVCFRHKTG
jgi:hypothetical protein